MVCGAFLVILFVLCEIDLAQCQTLLGDKCKARIDGYWTNELKRKSSETNDRLTKLESELNSRLGE